MNEGETHPPIPRLHTRARSFSPSLPPPPHVSPTFIPAHTASPHHHFESAQTFGLSLSLPPSLSLSLTHTHTHSQTHTSWRHSLVHARSALPSPLTCDWLQGHHTRRGRGSAWPCDWARRRDSPGYPNSFSVCSIVIYFRNVLVRLVLVEIHCNFPRNDVFLREAGGKSAPAPSARV